jgi:ABC-type uncharacterized transport system YnjBCD permease subunit
MRNLILFALGVWFVRWNILSLIENPLVFCHIILAFATGFALVWLSSKIIEELFD